jgi:peptide deformylase
VSLTEDNVSLCEDLKHTLLHGPRTAIGLAAPQIGVCKRAFVMAEVLPGGRVKVHTCINPEILRRRGVARTREGCLSFGDDEYVEVERAAEIELAYCDQAGWMPGRWFRGILAVCAQHECDHLEGKLMSDYGELKQWQRGQEPE